MREETFVVINLEIFGFASLKASPARTNLNKIKKEEWTEIRNVENHCIT